MIKLYAINSITGLQVVFKTAFEPDLVYPNEFHFSNGYHFVQSSSKKFYINPLPHFKKLMMSIPVLYPDENQLYFATQIFFEMSKCFISRRLNHFDSKDVLNSKFIQNGLALYFTKNYSRLEIFSVIHTEQYYFSRGTSFASDCIAALVKKGLKLNSIFKSILHPNYEDLVTSLMNSLDKQLYSRESTEMILDAINREIQ